MKTKNRRLRIVMIMFILSSALAALSPAADPETEETGKILLSLGLGYYTDHGQVLLSLGAEFRLAPRLHLEILADYDPTIQNQYYSYYPSGLNIGMYPGVASVGDGFGRIHGLGVSPVFRLILSPNVRLYVKGGPCLIFYHHPRYIDENLDPLYGTYLYAGLGAGIGAEYRLGPRLHARLGIAVKKIFHSGGVFDPDSANRFAIQAGIVYTVRRSYSGE